VTPALPTRGGLPSLAERAYRSLEERLVTLQLAPGALVQEKELAAVLGIGRTPVREAIQKLEGHGILQILPRKGLMVAPVRRSELLQVVEARRVLERLMVVKASERADADQRGALAVLATHLESAEDDLAAFFRLDRRLDYLLKSACGNRYLVRALAPLHMHCRRLWYLHRDRQNRHQAALLHAALARSVAEGDGSGAVRALNGIIGVIGQMIGELDDMG
jgi:DNA-binding GntR family transcriptional regulator